MARLSLKIVSGTLDVEFEGSLIDEAQKQLKEASKIEETAGKPGAKGTVPGDIFLPKLDQKQKMPI